MTSNSSGQNFALTTPAVLRMAAVLSSISPVTVYGSINVHSADYSVNYNGNLRLLAGATTSDNGDFFTPSTWTVLYVQPGSYVIQPNIPGFGTSNISVTASSDVVSIRAHAESQRLWSDYIADAGRDGRVGLRGRSAAGKQLSLGVGRRAVQRRTIVGDWFPV